MADESMTSAGSAQDSGAQRKRGPRPGTDAARRGGEAVVAKLGVEHFRRIGRMGGRSAAKQHGPDFYTDIGRKGGNATRSKLGLEHYQAIGRKGGLSTHRRGEPDDAPAGKP